MIHLPHTVSNDDIETNAPLVLAWALVISKLISRFTWDIRRYDGTDRKP